MPLFAPPMGALAGRFARLLTVNVHGKGFTEWNFVSKNVILRTTTTTTMMTACLTPGYHHSDRIKRRAFTVMSQIQ